MRSQLRRLLKKIHIECTTPLKEVSNMLTFLYVHHLDVDSIDQNQFHDAPKKLNKKTAFIHFEKAYRLIETKAEIRSSVACFSFDEVANNIVSALKDFDVNCCIFVNSAFIEASDSLCENFYASRFHLSKAPSSWKTLAGFITAGGVIGSHINNCCRLSGFDYGCVGIEIVQSKQMIKDKLNVPCDCFAWSYGTAKDYTLAQLELVKKHYLLSLSAISSATTFYYSEHTINRNYFERDWRYSHLKYFLSTAKDRSCMPGNWC